MNERLANKYGIVVKVALEVSRRNDHSNAKSVGGVVDRRLSPRFAYSDRQSQTAANICPGRGRGCCAP